MFVGHVGARDKIAEALGVVARSVSWGGGEDECDNRNGGGGVVSEMGDAMRRREDRCEYG